MISALPACPLMLACAGLVLAAGGINLFTVGTAGLAVFSGWRPS